MSARPLVAIVGRPNVGKSTFFNRIIGKRVAIVEDVPGVTRDRHYGDSDWQGKNFTLIDTGGFTTDEKDPLLKQVRQQAQLAVEECEVILFVVEGRHGITAADQTFANLLRKSGKPVLVVANKIDSRKHEEESPLAELYKLGFDDIFALSAEHGRNIDSVLDKLIELLPAQEPEPEPEEGAVRPVRLAIVGRPNVGKSTLINAMLKQDRMVTSPEAGTTRDSIDSELTFKGKQVVITDTAGLRRKKAIAQQVEQYGVVAAMKSIDRSDITVLVLDSSEAGADQELKLAGIAVEKGKALIIVVNKWDVVDVDSATVQRYREALEERFQFVGYAPIVYASALTGAKVNGILETAKKLHEQYLFKAPTPQLNRLLEHMVEHHPAPFSGGKPLRLYYAAQVTAAPPTFIFTCNRPAGVPDRYKRYITNQLRKTFDLQVPIRIFFRERPGQAKRAARKDPRLANKRPRRRED